MTLALRSTEVHDPSLAMHVSRIVGVIARTTMMAREGFRQITICHEFGHMLGLPDEYICLTQASRNLLQMLDINRARSEFSVEKWLALQEAATGIRRDNPLTLKNQVEFLKLCSYAERRSPALRPQDLQPDVGGDQVPPSHAVTLWQCLGHLTAPTVEPEDWQIVLLRT